MGRENAGGWQVQGKRRLERAGVQEVVMQHLSSKCSCFG